LERVSCMLGRGGGESSVIKIQNEGIAGKRERYATQGVTRDRIQSRPEEG